MIVLALLVMAAPAAAYAHGSLKSSAPASGARLATAPRELRLTFTEVPELAFSRLSLLAPDGQPVALGELARAPDPATLVSAITGTLAPGVYTVRWQIAGKDGHPVRGEFSFTIVAGAGCCPVPAPPGEAAGGMSAPGQPTPPAAHHAPVATATFDASSWPYVVVRWLTFGALLLVIGAVTFRVAVLGSLRRDASPAVLHPASASAARIATWAAATLVMAAGARLYMQSVAMHGSARALDAAPLGAMVSGTVWGWGWLLQVVAALVAIVAFRAARGGSHVGWRLGGAAAFVLAFTPALAGHAISAPTLAPLLMLADAAHVIGAAGWLGSLCVLIAAGLPAALRLEENERGPAVAKLVNAFSPIALASAGTAAASGVLAAWVHLGAADALWSSAYGRTLLLKLGIISIVAGTGAYNWLRVRPALGDEAGARRVRRSAEIELGVAVIVLAITAVLVATPTPRDSARTQDSLTVQEQARS